MSKIKVLEVIPALNDGGAETLVASYVRLMNREECEPVVVVFHPRQETVNCKRVAETKTRTVSVYKTNSFIKKVMFRLLGDWYIPVMLKKIIKKERPQAIHTHLSVLRYFAPISDCLKGIRVFYTCHSEPELMFVQSKERRSAEHLIQNNGLRLVALHEDMRVQLNEMFNVDDSVVIKNGVDFNKLKNVERSKDEIRQGLGIPADAFVLGHIGRYADSKNHKFLVEVFKAVYAREKNAFLLLVGSGVNYELIKEKIAQYGLENRVKMFKSRSDIPEILKAMDVFVFPSWFEGLSVTMVEAQVSGVRCVVSDRINSASFLSPKTVALSLDDGCERWADAVLDRELVTDKPYGDLDEYDLNKEMRRLEGLYKGEF